MTKKNTTQIRLSSSGTASSKTLKKFVDAGKSKNQVLAAVDRYLLSRPRDKSRRTDVLHPSEIVSKDWCYRASYFLLQGHEPASEPGGKRGLRSALVFAEGHSIHDKWQSWFTNMGVMYGLWKCQKCLNAWMDTSPKGCPTCSSTDVKYAEVPVSNTDLRIEGRADGWLKGVAEKPLLLEIKSMGPGSFIFEDKDAWKAADGNYETAWKNFTAPFIKHNLQAQVYMHLLEGQPDAPDTAVFIYESKPNQEVKEFYVNKSSLLTTPIFEAAAYIVEAIQNQTPPECNIRGSWKCWRCEDYE